MTKPVVDQRDRISHLEERVAWLETQLLSILHGAATGDQVKDGKQQGTVIGLEAGCLLVQWQGDALVGRLPVNEADFVNTGETLHGRRMRKLGIVT